MCKGSIASLLRCCVRGGREAPCCLHRHCMHGAHWSVRVCVPAPQLFYLSGIQHGKYLKREVSVDAKMV